MSLKKKTKQGTKSKMTSVMKKSTDKKREKKKKKPKSNKIINKKETQRIKGIKTDKKTVRKKYKNANRRKSSENENSAKKFKIKSKNRLKARISKTQRKISLIIIYSAIILILFSAIVGLASMLLFKISSINLVGQSQYSENELRGAIGVKEGDSLIFCDTNEIKNNIENKLPYIEVLQITKEYPESLVVEVEQAKVKYNIECDDGYIYINDEFRILGKDANIKDEGIVLKGVALKSDVPSTYAEFTDESSNVILQEFNYYLNKYEVENITQINLTDKLSFEAVYDNRITIKFGYPADLDYKMKMIQGVLKSESVSGDIKGVIDASLAVEKNRVYFRPTYG
ncbi:MAG: FtsQ-type POTRA domain-containing protein [Clostridia bacterium]|nr:FtsQ-type POTRA domain-containing protein [Clostridia bacterium]